jgi:hypothetical protein
MDLINAWWAIIRDGVHHIQPLQFVIIGLIAGWLAGSLAGVVFGSLGASVVYIAVDRLWPVLFNQRTFAMPVFDSAFWHFFLSLYCAFLVIVAVVYIARQLVDSIRG